MQWRCSYELKWYAKLYIHPCSLVLLVLLSSVVQMHSINYSHKSGLQLCTSRRLNIARDKFSILPCREHRGFQVLLGTEKRLHERTLSHYQGAGAVWDGVEHVAMHSGSGESHHIAVAADIGVRGVRHHLQRRGIHIVGVRIMLTMHTQHIVCL